MAITSNQIGGGLAGGAGGFFVIDSNLPNVFGPQIINSYTTLAIPAYWRAMVFASGTQASFHRYVSQNGVKAKHPVNTLLCRRINSTQDAKQFWRTIYFHRHHYGNGFAEIIRDFQYNPVAIVNLLPEMVLPFRWADKETGEMSQWYFVYGVRPHVVAGQDMIHLQGGISYDGIASFNPVWLLQETFERSRLIDRFTTRFLTKGGIVRGVVEIPGGIPKDTQETIIDTIKNQMSGANAERDIMVLSDSAKFSNAGTSPKDSQLMGMQHANTVQIAQITGVDPVALFDLGDSKYNGNTELTNAAMMRDLFRPLIEADESQLSLKLLSDDEWEDGYRITIDPSNITRGDPVSTNAIITGQKIAGVITTNEARNALGYPQDSDPASNSLKTLGDTTPQGDGSADPKPKPPIDKPSYAIQPFAALISDVQARVAAKTAKAQEAARKRCGDDREKWTAWANVFAQEQGKYTADALGPVVNTIRSLGGSLPDETAGKIGDRYADALKSHFYNGEQPEPELQGLITNYLDGYHEANS